MKEKVAITSILANMVLAGGKIAVGIFSNSVAVLAAGVDSFVDIFSSAISYTGIKISKKPADQGHPYGHYKFEVLSGMIITIIVLATGIGIVYESYQGFFKPTDIKISYLAFGVMIFSVAVNEIMARLKIYYGKKENSVSLLSDGIHSRIDVFASLAVLLGLFLSHYWIYADALLALLIGLYIIKQAFSVGKEAASSLLDASAGEEIERKIKSIVEKRGIEIDALKTQKKGSAITANFDIKLSNDLSVDRAAKISDDLRSFLMKEIENLQYVAIQIKSHEVETSFYKPEFGRSFGWQRRGKFRDKIQDAQAQGPEGYCVCSQCNYKISHQRGVPCSTLKCPVCNINLEREQYVKAKTL